MQGLSGYVSPDMSVETPGLASAWRAYSSAPGIARERTVHPLTVAYVLFLVYRVSVMIGDFGFFTTYCQCTAVL